MAKASKILLTQTSALNNTCMRLIRVLTSDSVTKSICAMKTQQALGEQHNDHKDDPIHLYLRISNKSASNITQQRHGVQRHEMGTASPC
jgi:hypothetical protein